MASTSLLRLLLLLLLQLLLLLGASSLTHSKQNGTIAFATVGRARFAFDIYTLSLPPPPSPPSSILGLLETRLTNGESVNYNGHFVPASHQQSIPTSFNLSGDILAFVSESQGRAQIYLSIFSSSPHRSTQPPGSYGARQTVELQLDPDGEEARQPFMRDRPVIAGGCAIYVSTQQASGKPRKSWAAVYSTELRTRITQRLTPQGVADYSPAVSPSGEWTIVASDQRRGWQGEVHELHTDLYLLKTSDGSQRTLLLQHGGWPSWGDDSTFFFHREEHGWWGVFRATISQSLLRGKALNSGDEVVRVERVTPLGLHAFTPAASPMGDWVAVATRRPESDYRHIELFDLKSQTFVELTRRINPRRHHYNPFVSSDSKHVGYHRCRGMEEEEEQQQQQQSVPTVTNLRSLSSSEKGRSLLERGARQALIKSSPIIPHLEHIQSPLPQLSLLRLDGTFPSFSPDGSLIAFIPDLDNDGGVYVMRLDGSGRRKIFSGLAFGTAWDWKREGVVYTSYGPNFATQKTTVHIVSIFNAHKIAAGENIPLESKVLTKAGSNNAFPSASPDGKHLVFRSGRSGYKNLYIMDAVQGEEGGLRRLTEGPWTDTMCSWSPDGEWIAFASDRDNPGGGSFVVYFIHPNGTGLHKVLNSGIAGRVNHPSFSPDSRSLVFTTDYAGISAEPVSVPHQYQPYGEIFIARLDGSGLQRLTHNSYEDGTPSWGRKFISQLALSTEGERDACSFRDDTWLDIKGNYVHGVAC